MRVRRDQWEYMCLQERSFDGHKVGVYSVSSRLMWWFWHSSIWKDRCPPCHCTHCCHFDYREQRGVTTDLGSDPTLVRGFSPVIPVVLHKIYPGSLQHSLPSLWSRGVGSMLNVSCCRVNLTRFLYSAVFYQDQSKRKETRMILFFVCTKCNHSFMDPNLPTETRQDAMEDS